MERVIEERLRAREGAIREAREFSNCVSEVLGEITAILYGSYARGDFNEWSDVDVLIIAKELPQNPLERLNLIDVCIRRYPRIEPVLITVKEFIKMRCRNPAILEALERGVKLVDKLNIG
ncbi:MAG: nucleotidyltransferase domain-containing protein [Sulfolobales archaeon]|jgi:predicted nucleotidyltransferase